VKVAIVGRPNTGKSSLFNRLAGKNKAVTDDLPGVTRDRLFAEVDYYGQDFELIDTGGYEFGDGHIIQHIVEQIHIAVEEAELILFVVDGKDGLTSTDVEIANLLRKANRDIVLVVNKVDNEKLVYDEFHSLGMKKLIPVSAAHALGIGDLIDVMVEKAKASTTPKGKKVYSENVIKIAIAGRPNTGKSTLLNAILGHTRVVTSPIPGTTRDVIDIPLSNDRGDFILLDTAGIRRHAKTGSRIEDYSILRSKKAIEEADVALLVIDGEEGFTTQDKKVSELISDSGAACVIVVNKKDKMKKRFTDEELHQEIPYLNYAPLLYISAVYDKDFSKLFKVAVEVNAERHKKLSTGDLNRFFQNTIRYKTPPMVSGKEVKLKYIVQAAKQQGGVPRFIICGKNAKMVHASYKKFLIAKIREEFGFKGNPIALIFKEDK
jgi:GTP-binding protein